MNFNTTCRSLLAVVLAVGASCEIASAQTPVTVPNFSFEATNGDLITTAGGNAGVNNTGTYWTCSSTAGGTVYVVNFSPTGVDFTNATTPSLLPPTGNGTNYLVLNIAGPPTNHPVCWQDLGALLPNTTYTLTIGLGQSDVGATNAALATGQGFIGLVNGRTPFYPVLGAKFVDNSIQAPGTFVDFSLTITTPAVVSGDLSIVMEGTNGAQLCFDNVRLTTTPAANPVALLPSISAPAANPTAVPVAPVAFATNYLGSVVTLSEHPAGTSPFTYQWQSDNGTVGVTFTSIPLATNASYVVTNSTVSTVEYQVIVTNSLGTSSTSAPVTLTVIQGPPVIVQDTLPSVSPSDMVGSSETFTVVFTGDQPMGYQWQVNYLQGAGPGPITGKTANGTTNSTLILTNLQVSDTGEYTCVVTNDQSVTFGSTVSTASYLTVTALPAADSYGVIQAQAAQEGFGGNTLFTPTWVLPTNSLIAGVEPINASTNGNFQLVGCFGTNVLTDGTFGTITPAAAGEPMATIGNPSQGPGYYVSYLLPTNANGWDITNIAIYGGWTDNGRDQQSINIFYSTVAAPTNFSSEVTQVNFKPSAPANVQVAARSILTSGTTTPAIVHNVAGIQFNMNLQAGGFNDNGWEGYSQFQIFGTASAPAPIWVQNMVPGTGSDVVGSAVTLSCVASYALPLTYHWTVAYLDGHGSGSVTGTSANTLTNSSLILTNLQFSDSGTYTLLATNVAARTGLVSLPCAFFVNPAPTADYLGVIDSPASQTGNSAVLTPTWTIASGSLIAGMLPSATNAGNFTQETATVGLPVLTDGIVGYIGGGDQAMVTAGSTAGTGFTYTLPASTYGYNITSIVVYGGWGDGGRDEQEYTISASHYNAPTAFTLLTAFDYAPPTELPGAPGVPNMTRVTYTAGTGAYLAHNVSELAWNFNVRLPGTNSTTTGGENGYQGYSEIDVYGTPATAPAPIAFVTNMVPEAGSDVTGSSVTMYCAATSPNLPLTYQWQASYGAGPGPVNGTPANGTTNSSLILTNLQYTDSATYTLTVTDHLGNTLTSLPCYFTVNFPPQVDSYGLIDSPASQQSSYTTILTPTWTATPGSLIAGMLPTALYANNGQLSFTNALNGDAITNGLGLSVLTDGLIGYANGSADSGAMVMIGSGNSGGNSLTYTLPYSEGGYSISAIQVYGGWGNGNRDEQLYTMYYSTVNNPSVFTRFLSYDYQPPAETTPFQFPNMTRMTYTPATGLYIIQNVAQIYINFTSNTVTTGTGENGYQGYSEIDIYGTPSAAAVFPPTVTTNTLPSVCQDVVGSSETFVAGFISSSPMTYQWYVDHGLGAGPQPVTGANFSGVTTPVLTDNNLQSADSGSYSCVATVAAGPAAGTATSATNTFTVNPAPTASGNIIIADALQAWSNSTFAPAFTPTWTVQPGSIIAGTLPTSSGVYHGTASFSEDAQASSGNGGGGLPVLTDGLLGSYGDNTDINMATCGSREGTNIIYTLGGPSGGYNISSIVTYGGWVNNGRDEQAYTVYYSTFAAPTTFINLTANDYKVASVLTTASGWNNYPDCSRSTITAVNGILATNVYAIGFNFNTPNGENNWEGYSEIQVFGTVSLLPRFSAPTFSGGDLILSGIGGTPGGGYTILTTTNVAAPLSAWTTNSQATFNSSGAFSLSIPVVATPPAQFFQIRVP